MIDIDNYRYFKRFTIVDLDRLNLPLEENRLSYTHANNTLIISVGAIDRNLSNCVPFYLVQKTSSCSRPRKTSSQRIKKVEYEQRG